MPVVVSSELSALGLTASRVSFGVGGGNIEGFLLLLLPCCFCLPITASSALVVAVVGGMFLLLYFLAPACRMALILAWDSRTTDLLTFYGLQGQFSWSAG